MHSMSVSGIMRIVVPAAAGFALAAMAWTWSRNMPVRVLEKRLPGDRTVGEVVEPVAEDVPLPGRLERSGGAPADIPGVWPWFRGPNRDAISTEEVPLLHSFGPQGPSRLWTADMGEGYAAPAVRNGRLYVLDYDEVKRADALRCLSLADGKEIWRRWYSVRIKHQHGVSRTVPAVTDRYVVTIGPKCHVLCADAETGEDRWHMDLVKDFGSKVPPWYAGQCPLIDGDRAILAPAGREVLMMAVDCASGNILWKTPNPDGWEMTHSSILPVELCGQRQYVYCASGGAVGVSPDDGRVLWKTTRWRGRIATVPTPVAAGDDRLFFCSGYTAGAAMLQLRRQDAQLMPDELFRLTDKEFGSEQQTPIYYQGHIYGIRSDGQFVCLDADGKITWKSGRNKQFGQFGGPYVLADGMFLVMNDEGVLTLVEATSQAYKPLATAKVLDGHESWGPMALVSGRLIVRDLKKMACLDMRAPQQP